MTGELHWRRRWKPDLSACPWKPLDLQNLQAKYFMKAKFGESSYEVLITDLTQCWYEHLAGASLKNRVTKLNPSIEASVSKILDQIKSNLENPGKETVLKLTPQDENIAVEIQSEMAGIPFTFMFKASPASNEKGRDHLTIPLMAMVGELYRQQQELFKSLIAKDKEIDDFKCQGAKVSRKYLETPPFDEVAFWNNMLTSKGFEEEVKTFGEKAFTSLGQDLYREITTKRAWLMSSPLKDGDLEAVEPMESMSGPQEGPSVESWSNRLPTSMGQRNVSPSKASSSSDSPQKASSRSPASSKGSGSESTPVKDTELLRRQALERKLEQEEAKQQEKVKKKKKLKF